MTALSTHDTKRTEDVRARLLAVSGDTAAWTECSRLFAAAADEQGVDRPTAHLMWQTLVGVGEISADRLHTYLTKAVREAKVHTAWVDGDPDYEARVLAMADLALAPGPLRSAVEDAASRNAEPVRATVLGQKLLQLLLPGEPDTYQGCEVVNLSLVDPDNRREVDYDEHERRLRKLRERGPADLDDEKLLATCRALAVRRELPDCFGESGSYLPLPASTEHVVGFLRGGRVAAAATRAPRRLAGSGGWREETITLPAGTWHDELTGAAFEGGAVRCAEVFAALPVALLVARDA
jgi:(1->4)-alpha-D-glucan 1-alpha-D-glucosylmutase